MKPAAFEYCRATEVDEAIHHLSARGPDAKVLAGGQSLIPMMKLRLARPAALVDINPILPLDYTNEKNGFIAIGATRRFLALETEAMARSCPLLRAALRYIGHEAIRGRGTLCGSIAHADPVSETPVVACCLDAQMLVKGPNGCRTIASSDFFRSFLTTALAPDELLTEVRLPVMQERTGWAFQEASRRHAKFALIAVTLQRDSRGNITKSRIAMGAVSERPVRADQAEAGLVGQPGGSETFRAAAAAATAGLDPPFDVHGSGKFRKQLAQTLLERALAEAWQRASAAA